MLKLTAKRTKWFTVKEDPSGETQVELVYLKPGEVADIEAKANNVKGRQRGDDFETEIEFDMNHRTRMFVLRSIVDWKGFNNVNDKPLPCNEKNKLQVLKEFGWFGPFIEECREELAEEVESEQEEVEKN